MLCDPNSSSIVTVWLHFVKYCCVRDNEGIKLGRKRKTENASLIVNCGLLSWLPCARLHGEKFHIPVVHQNVQPA